MASTGVVAKAGYEPVVSVDWLHSNLREPDLKVTALPFLRDSCQLYLTFTLFMFCSRFWMRHGTCQMSRGIPSKNIR